MMLFDSSLPPLASNAFNFDMATVKANFTVAGATEETPESYNAALEIPIPKPSLKHSFRLVCDLEPVRALGEGLRGDGGQ